MGKRFEVAAAIVLVIAIARPTFAQEDRSWQNQWFWGGQVGTLIFNTQGTEKAALDVGGHWLITAGRTGLYLSYDAIIADSISSFLPNGLEATWSNAQIIQASIYAFPTDGRIQIYLGGGFAIENISNARPIGTFTTPQQLEAAQEAVDEVATKAYVVLGGGLQLRVTPRLALFGQYGWMPSVDDFLIQSQQHWIVAGIRYAVTGAQSGVEVQR